MPRQHGEWTPDQLATQRRFEQCVAAGGHHPSGDTLIRDKGGIQFTFLICARCGVPYYHHHPAKPKRGSTSSPLRDEVPRDPVNLE